MKLLFFLFAAGCSVIGHSFCFADQQEDIPNQQSIVSKGVERYSHLPQQEVSQTDPPALSTGRVLL